VTGASGLNDVMAGAENNGHGLEIPTLEERGKRVADDLTDLKAVSKLER
jgi:hypothetical protein